MEKEPQNVLHIHNQEGLDSHFGFLLECYRHSDKDKYAQRVCATELVTTELVGGRASIPLVVEKLV